MQMQAPQNGRLSIPPEMRRIGSATHHGQRVQIFGPDPADPRKLLVNFDLDAKDPRPVPYPSKLVVVDS